MNGSRASRAQRRDAIACDSRLIVNNRDLRPTRRLNSADLPTFGRPTIATLPALAVDCLIDARIGVPLGLQLSHAIPARK